MVILHHEIYHNLINFLHFHYLNLFYLQIHQNPLQKFFLNYKIGKLILFTSKNLIYYKSEIINSIFRK